MSPAECNTEPCSEFAAVSPTYNRINNGNLYIGTSMCASRSPPLPAALASAPLDAGIEDSDTTHFLFGDPVPRKRKNSARLMFRCLWKNCGKVLSTSSAIQKHIRFAHLGRGKEKEHSDGEEDFYYTEMDVNVDTLSDGLSSLTPTSPTSAGPPPFPDVGSLAAAQVSDLPIVSPLSVSAPSTLCAICDCTQPEARNRPSVSIAAVLKTCLTYCLGVARLWLAAIGYSSCAFLLLIRKTRGEAKKCRKVYGMERKDLWCTACRWKKACQRFLD
uniref:SLC2A4 regulator n=1 Tax=Leptobrachium leishanense TaxID=445787 RepID=A0A8C5QVD7_9ANUR